MTDVSDKIAEIVDPDAFHPLLKTDGLGAHWHARRAVARKKAEKVLEAGATDASSLIKENAYLRSVLEEILTYRRGEGVYDFSKLGPEERSNESFDAWQRIESEMLVPALNGSSETEREGVEIGSFVEARAAEA